MPKERPMRSGQTVPNVAPNLEHPACPLCGSDQRAMVYRLAPPYGVVQCGACGMSYLYPRLIESAMQDMYRRASYYGGGGCGYSDSSYRAQKPALRATFKRFLRNLAKRNLTGGQLLEIGCGYGYLLDEAREFYNHRVGTELSAEGAEAAREYGAEVFVGGSEQVAPDRQFDCVIATQVIEHVYDPLQFVREIVRRTKPRGHIVVVTPDIGGVLSKCMGRHWPSFKVPEHVLYFDFPTLRMLMCRAGLSDVRRLPYPHAFPLGLVAAKFGFVLPPPLSHLIVWVPTTTVAAYGTVPYN
jgi:SAM-dependent methyltransferase